MRQRDRSYRLGVAGGGLKLRRRRRKSVEPGRSRPRRESRHAKPLHPPCRWPCRAYAATGARGRTEPGADDGAEAEPAARKPKIRPRSVGRSDARPARAPGGQARCQPKPARPRASRCCASARSPTARCTLTPAAQPAPGAQREAESPRAKRAAQADAQPTHWSYDGEGGPARLGPAEARVRKCGSGTRQSPIDIRDGIRVDLEPVQFDYRPARSACIDNGHTVQVNVAAGNFIDVMGRRFELEQFHFHRPSEERIEGKQFDMVAHLVHKDRRRSPGRGGGAAGARRCAPARADGVEQPAAGEGRGGGAHARRSTSTTCCPRTRATSPTWAR